MNVGSYVSDNRDVIRYNCGVPHAVVPGQGQSNHGRPELLGEAMQMQTEMAVEDRRVFEGSPADLFITAR